MEDTEATCEPRTLTCAKITIKSRKKVENQLTKFEKLIGQEQKARHMDHPNGL